MKSKFNPQLANDAFERYMAASDEINKMKSGIEQNRNGSATLAEIQNNPAQLAKRLAREGVPLTQALERINGVPNFQDVLVLNKIFKLSESVCRITIKNQYGSSGFGTGFLIGPGIVITNNHVFPDAESAKNSYVQFNYELDEKGEPVPSYTFGLDPEKLFLTSSFEPDPNNPASGLDFSIVAVKSISKEGKNINEFPYAILDEKTGKITDGENCVIIQHPKGDYKKIVLKDIRMLTLTENFLIYESDTLPGSSGAVVIGLGTGEVVALHHSGVPRKNTSGQILKKDGSVFQPGDSDESIDWIGNEGIRVSRIIHAVRRMNIPEKMKPFISQAISLDIHTPSPATPHVEDSNPINMPIESNTDVVNSAIQLMNHPIDESRPILSFEIELSEIEDMQTDWKLNYRKIFPDIISSEPLFPFSTNVEQKRMLYINLRSNDNPWEVAAKLEALPQVDSATPDLPTETDAQHDFLKQTIGHTRFESSGPAGVAEWNEGEFIKEWESSVNCKNFIKNEDYVALRQWHRFAIGMPDEISKLFGSKANWEKIKQNLGLLNLVQLDTGYTDHSKVVGGYNLQKDEDFIDGEDARDEMVNGVLQHPGHGTRTASIIIGNNTSGEFQHDGNYGLLSVGTDEQPEADPTLPPKVGHKQSLIKLIPYRIAQSVVLISRGKNLVDAANHAISTNADVMFMCMGSYPRPMFYEVSKSAYDRGVIWVCAAGNEVEMVIAPALYPGTISVAASNPDNRPWKGSSRGSTVDIAAPGEDVYVPFINKKFEDIMVYGSGTSYATPQVAAAAMLWRAKHHDVIRALYKIPWQIVEAFRHCLRATANKPNHWDTKNYGSGILDMAALLNCPLPRPEDLKYAYEDKPKRPSWDLGMREGIHFIWKVIMKKITPGPESTNAEMILTERARITMAALTGGPASQIFESYTEVGYENSEKILNMYFKSYQ